MDFVGSIVLTLHYLEIIAWSSFALVYPLCASIQAMENKSRKDMRKLMAYWIIFSLLLLFEIALGNIVRLITPLWSCIKLMVVCWFGLPHFEQADYFYCNQIDPFLSELRSSIIHYLCKPMEEIILTEESFLALVEKFVDLNGSEALEELVARKAEQKEECKGNIIIEPMIQLDTKDGNMKPTRNIEREENVTTIQLDAKDGNVKPKRNKKREENAATVQASLQNKPYVEDLKVEQEESKGSIEPVVYQPDAKDEEHVKPERNIEMDENLTTIQASLQKKPGVEDVKAEQKEESKGSIEPVVQPDSEDENLKQTERSTEENVATTQVVVNSMDELHQPAAATVEEAAAANQTERNVDQTEKNIKTKNTIKNILTCTTCQLSVHHEKIMQAHLLGKKHRTNLQKEIIMKHFG
ncbi:receptor expression-enhancing protein 3-B-like isoform X2 [Impatiens glandulifera]|uniref:receptor expression-enhancing protein 3-B-like isoform X2 n=1 Tax=Impatiens glandulifera TaxID=253017 RepID=UPI001FB08E0F|nr:receptor expression-enhancing protein 3-B-like isoform X2 [Impatiens glandulifera]